MSTSFPKVLGKLDGFPKNLEKSRESLAETFRKLLGDRNIPLGAPVISLTVVGYKIIIANSALSATRLLVGYLSFHFNAHS